MREVEDEVHAKRPGCQRAKIPDLLPQQWGRAQLRLENTESASVAHGGDKFRSGEIGAHRRDHDRSVDPKPFAKARV